MGRFESIIMNGADDVVKYRKWVHCNVHNRGLCMLRPGFSEALLDGMRRDGADPDDGVLILGPEMPDLSSTQARMGSARGDREEVLKVLHPSVADWLLARDANALELQGWKEDRRHPPSLAHATSSRKPPSASTISSCFPASKRLRNCLGR